MKRALTILLLVAVSQARASELPKPDTSPVFHRGSDFAFGLLVSQPIGMASRPWIGLIAGIGAGVGNEARYGKNFNVGHLAIISAGSLLGYGINKWERKHRRETRHQD